VPSRDRYLDDDEIKSFWQGCDQIGWPFGPVFKLLLLTAQRLSEVGGMRWSELNLDKRTWTLPSERAKNKKAHDIHLSDLAIEILDGLPRFDSDFVFPAPAQQGVEGKPVAGFHYAKGNIFKSMNAPDWRLHDLRRTAVTGMAQLGIGHHVVDKILITLPERSAGSRRPITGSSTKPKGAMRSTSGATLSSGWSIPNGCRPMSLRWRADGRTQKVVAGGERLLWVRRRDIRQHQPERVRCAESGPSQGHSFGQ
jgi:hypothetical protein